MMSKGRVEYTKSVKPMGQISELCGGSQGYLHTLLHEINDQHLFTLALIYGARFFS